MIANATTKTAVGLIAENEQLKAENAQLRELLKSASHHVRSEGDDTLLTMIYHVMTSRG